MCVCISVLLCAFCISDSCTVVITVSLLVALSTSTLSQVSSTCHTFINLEEIAIPQQFKDNFKTKTPPYVHVQIQNAGKIIPPQNEDMKNSSHCFDLTEYFHIILIDKPQIQFKKRGAR